MYSDYDAVAYYYQQHGLGFIGKLFKGIGKGFAFVGKTAFKGIKAVPKGVIKLAPTLVTALPVIGTAAGVVGAIVASRKGTAQSEEAIEAVTADVIQALPDQEVAKLPPEVVPHLTPEAAEVLRKRLIQLQSAITPPDLPGVQAAGMGKGLTALLAVAAVGGILMATSRPRTRR